MNTKPKNLRQIFSAAIVVILLAIFVGSFTLPHPLKKIAPEFDPMNIDSCTIYAYQSEVIPPLTANYTDYTFSLDPKSQEYTELIELLNSTKYRKLFKNYIDNHTHKITINPHIDIHFITDGTTYEISLFGNEMDIGPARNNSHYSPRDGKDFQQSVVDFIFENATLVKQETH